MPRLPGRFLLNPYGSSRRESSEGRARVNLALDVIDVLHVAGPRVTYPQFLRIFYGGRDSAGADRQWSRFRAKLRELGFLDASRSSTSAQGGGAMGLSRRWGGAGVSPTYGQNKFLTIHEAPARAWAERVLASRPSLLGPEDFAPNPRRRNVPTELEVATGRGYQSLEDWQVALSRLSRVQVAVLQALAELQVPMSVLSVAEHLSGVRVRSQTIVGPHPAKRPPCPRCGQDHTLRQHASHVVQGRRRSVPSLRQVAQALEGLRDRGYVDQRGPDVFAVTVTGYEASLAERQLRGVQLGLAFDPESEYESAMDRRAARRSRSSRADASFDFGANRNPIPLLVPVIASGVGMAAGDDLYRSVRGRRRGKNPLPAHCLIGRRRNPLQAVMLVGNPPRTPLPERVRRNVSAPPLRLPAERVRGELPLERAVREVPGMRQAVERYKKFHGTDPSGSVIAYDDGRPGREAAFLIGRAPEVVYDDVPQGSNKQGSVWVHKTSRKTPTYLVHMPRSKNTVLIGDMAHDGVGDWLRERSERRRDY